MNRTHETHRLQRASVVAAIGFTLGLGLCAAAPLPRRLPASRVSISVPGNVLRSGIPVAAVAPDWTWSGRAAMWITGLVVLGLSCQFVRHRWRQRLPAPPGQGPDNPLPARPAEELELRERELAAFQRISEIMQVKGGDPGMLNRIASEIGEMAGFPMVTIELCDFDRGVMVVRGAYGLALDDLPAPFEVPMDVTPSGEVARSGRLLIETGASRRRECSTPFLKRLGMEVFLCVPMKIHGRVAGTLSLAHRKPVVVEPHIIRQVESLANFLATLFSELKARDAMRRSEAELAAVYDRAPSVMCLFDEQLRVVRANCAAAEFAGRDRVDALPMSAAGFFGCPGASQGANPCFSAGTCQECELCRAVLETFRTGSGWRRVRVRKLREHREQLDESVVLVSTERIQVDGATRVLLCLEDVTHHERADEQIRSQAALLDVTRDAILVRDFSDHILYWNEGAHRLYGWTADEVLHQTMSEVLLGADLEPAVEALRAVREQEEWNGEMKHRTRQGTELTVQSRWTLVRGRGGVPKAILVVSTDITEKKRLEAQLLRAQRLESIGTLASGLAHDLNNVLAPIMMATHVLQEEAADDAARAWVQTLNTCARRGADIVRQVLLFARGVEGSRVVLHPKQLLEEMDRIARETFPKSIEIVARSCKQPLLFEGDATQMQQVLMNLCVNARDAMPDGGTLSLSLENVQLAADGVRVHPRAHAGDYVLFTVSDTGTGIAPELLDKIFDPFFTTKPIGHGTGLGLPTVLGIVENHGGFVLVESRVGRGTVFRVYLPAARLTQRRAAAEEGASAAPQGRGERILVVDDEAAIRKITYLMLTRNGYDAFLAADGREAVELFRQHQDAIKLVVTDLMMPKMNGPATIRALREIRPDVRTITITGMGEENKLGLARAAGSDDFLSKPFTSEQLLQKMAKLLNPSSLPGSVGS